MRVLVTGGAGFIGANLVRMLLHSGYRVVVLDNLSTGQRQYLERLPLDLVKGDILDSAVVGGLLPGCDGVIHLAAQTGVPGSLADPMGDCEANVLGTLTLLEACRQAGIGRFVFASSNAPLGRQSPPATEDKAPLPISPYGASKLAGEAYCLAYHGSWGLGTVVLRFGNVYGPFSAHKNSVVARFFKDIAALGRITVDGDGRQTRDFIYVGDLCRAVLLALRSDTAGEVFQVATGVETSIQDLALLVQEVVGRDVGLQFGPARQGDIWKNYSAIAKAREMLVWDPEVGLHDGLVQTWRWFQRLPL